MHLNFPFTLHRGVIDQPASHDDYVEQLIEQVLFTVPGERVNRPEFGCGIQHMVFKPGNSEVVAAALFTVHSLGLRPTWPASSACERVDATMKGGVGHRAASARTQTGARRAARFRH